MKLKYLYLLSIIFIAVSCHDDHLGVVEEPSHSDVVDGSGIYLNLNIASADRGRSSRADDDFVNYQDYPHESTILNGVVYVYEGTDEENAICVTSGELNIGEYNILTTAQQFATSDIPVRNIALKDFTYDASKQYFALVILNAKNDFIFPDVKNNEPFKEWANIVQTSDMKIQQGTYSHPINKTNQKDENGKSIPATYAAYYPTMTNASGHIGFNASVDTFTPKTLIAINSSDFSVKELSDTDVSHTTVYVQRNVARILLQPKLKDNGNALTFEDKEVSIGDVTNLSEYWTAEVNILNWGLDITNKLSYPVMNLDGSNLWWTKKSATTQKEFFHIGDQVFERCLWGKDPNYNKNYPDNDFNKATLPGQLSLTDARVPLYCLENTFYYEQMLQGQTTRVIMRGKWAFDEITQTNLSQKVKLPGGTEGTCYKSITERTSNGNSVGFYLMGKKDKVWCRAHIEEALIDKAKEIYGETCSLKFSWNNSYNIGGYLSLQDLFDDIKIANVSNPTDVDYQSITPEDNVWNKFATVFNLNNSINKEINYYYNCVTFYALRIPHFLDSDVPWDEGTEVKTKADGTRIADYKPKHLGRYGVVRNYSYVITVNGIHSLGEPTIPPITPDDTDDMPGELYLDVEVKVQAWAKHDITVGF